MMMDVTLIKRYASNKCRSGLTNTTCILHEVSIVIDRMHMVGHVDPWCKKSCDPSLFLEISKG